LNLPVLRFAPSPNGPLHLGHAYSALLNDRLAERLGGRLLLRIDDIDRERCRPEYEDAIIEVCRWLGIRFDGPIRRESDCAGEYTAAFDRLREMDLVYPAFMSRTEVVQTVMAYERAGGRWPRDPDGTPLYPDYDRAIGKAEAEAAVNEGRPHAFRLNTRYAVAMAGPLTWREFPADDPSASREVVANPAAWGDVLLTGRDIAASYHLAVVVDDAAQETTHVVRGKDLFHATSVHRLLQRLLDLPEPVYCHHRLVFDRNGRKLAKSDGDTGLALLREQGVTPADIRRLVGLEDAPG
jgi:glutamyl-Q tRNA(Asp) synthetase